MSENKERGVGSNALEAMANGKKDAQQDMSTECEFDCTDCHYWRPSWCKMSWCLQREAVEPYRYSITDKGQRFLAVPDPITAAPETVAELDRVLTELEVEKQLGLECAQTVQNFIKDEAPPGILVSGAKVMLGQHKEIRLGKMNASPDPERVCALSGPSKSCADRKRLREVNAELVTALEEIESAAYRLVVAIWTEPSLRISLWNDHGGADTQQSVNTARAALAKAKGEEA